MKRILILLAVVLVVAGLAFAAWKPQMPPVQPLVCRFVIGFPSGPYAFVPDVPIDYIHLERVGLNYYYIDVHAMDGTHYFYQFDQIRAGIRLNLEE